MSVIIQRKIPYFDVCGSKMHSRIGQDSSKLKGLVACYVSFSSGVRLNETLMLIEDRYSFFLLPLLILRLMRLI